jgi:hypothetical protein
MLILLAFGMEKFKGRGYPASALGQTKQVNI